MNLRGQVIWITGLSGSGKTTLADALQKRLVGSILLDGDKLRRVLGRDKSGFDLASRKELALTYSRLALLLAEQRFTVIVATISLFLDVHAWNRTNIPNYVEVFLDIPEHVREARDPKGLYAAARKGIINDMAGETIKVEFPRSPDILLDETYSVEKALDKICDFLKKSIRE